MVRERNRTGEPNTNPDEVPELMAFRTWREADEVLAATTGPATTKQQELGELADRPIPLHTPRIVAAATLRLALAGELNLPAPRAISDRYKARLQILQRSSDTPISPQTEEEADAWVTYLRLVRRRESLSELEINEGDVVETRAGEVAEVSSIGQDGRVFFKGGEDLAPGQTCSPLWREGMITPIQPQGLDGRPKT